MHGSNTRFGPCSAVSGLTRGIQVRSGSKTLLSAERQTILYVGSVVLASEFMKCLMKVARAPSQTWKPRRGAGGPKMIKRNHFEE